ncbi:hypothetical protein Agub_g8533, partial [Astrephomene gubernaculifera]
LTSLLARYPLEQPPLAMDCLGSHILLASEPLEISLLEVTLLGELAPTGNPRASIQTLRQISMFDVGRHLSDVALVPVMPVAAAAAAANGGMGGGGGGGGGGAGSGASPRQCVLLRWGGLLSVLDLEKGSEQALAQEVEAFWLSDAITCRAEVKAGSGGVLGGSGSGGLSAAAAAAAANSGGACGGACGGELRPDSSSASALGAEAAGSVAAAAGSSHPQQQQAEGHPGGGASATLPSVSPAAAPAASTATTSASTASTTLDVEMPWWLYGPAGMQLCFPSSLDTAQALPYFGSHKEAGQDIELEFDQEVYPVGVSLADDAIIGITQRIMRGPAGLLSSGCFSAASAAQLPCFHPIPESQPVLPCLLRRLLQRGAFPEAVSLARRHARGPHFARSLEWLLFTALDID